MVTDTATLEALEQAGGSYTILRDHGDVFWDIRMNINDVTNNFANPFTLPKHRSAVPGESEAVMKLTLWALPVK